MLERRPGTNKCRGTDLVWETAGNMRESNFCDKSLMKLLSCAALGGNLTTIRVPYLWETGTWKISSSCQAGSTHSCSSCTGGHLEGAEQGMSLRSQVSGLEREGANRLELLPQVLEERWFCSFTTHSSIFVILLWDSLAGR